MEQKRTIVVALGGNALQQSGEASASAQEKVARSTAHQLAALIKQGHHLIIVHGNGPQVGDIVLHEEAINTKQVPAMPLDSSDAMSQGLIGYWLQQAISSELDDDGINKTVATVVTQVVVDSHDPAFQNPTKPIGPFYSSEATAREKDIDKQGTFKEDAGRGWRRVVPSPRPQDIVEKRAIKTLLDGNCVVIAAGGGGIPVISSDGTYKGVEAVIDKDFSAALLADQLDADQLIILTAVEAAMINYGTPDQRAIHETDSATMQQYIKEGYFAPGSMLPKVQAALNFTSKPNRQAVIASLEHVKEAADGHSGTIITS